MVEKIKTSQRNTSGDMDYWNSKRYELIREYYLRSPWVPPFNLIGRVHHFISFVKKFFSKCSDAKVSENKFFRKKSEVFKRPMRHRFKNRQDIKISSFKQDFYNKRQVPSRYRVRVRALVNGDVAQMVSALA